MCNIALRWFVFIRVFTLIRYAYDCLVLDENERRNEIMGKDFEGDSCGLLR